MVNESRKYRLVFVFLTLAILINFLVFILFYKDRFTNNYIKLLKQKEFGNFTMLLDSDNDKYGNLIYSNNSNLTNKSNY